MGQYIKLSNGNRQDIYDIIYGDTIIIKHINDNIDALPTIANFYGSNIIDCLDVYDTKTNILVDRYSIRKKCTHVSAEYLQIDNVNKVIITVMLNKPELEDEVVIIKNKLGIVNVSELTLDELKDYKIRQSKEDLAQYLEEHPLTSNCHGGVVGTYSITDEKQMRMTQTLVAYQTDIALGNTSEITWNETGSYCEKWEPNDFITLVNTVRELVKPLIALQQHIEVDIKKCTTIEEVNGLTIDYSTADNRIKTK